MPKRLEPRTIDDGRMIFRNFAGTKGPFNEEGDRSFTLVLPEDVAEDMIREGWTTVKKKPKYGTEPEDEEFEYHLPVAVEYRKGRPPRVLSITKSKGRVELGAEEVAVLDIAEIDKIAVTLSPYSWSNARGESGVKAYLKTLFVWIHEDPLFEMYGDAEGRPMDIGDNHLEDDEADVA